LRPAQNPDKGKRKKRKKKIVFNRLSEKERKVDHFCTSQARRRGKEGGRKTLGSQLRSEKKGEKKKREKGEAVFYFVAPLRERTEERKGGGERGKRWAISVSSQEGGRGGGEREKKERELNAHNTRF